MILILSLFSKCNDCSKYFIYTLYILKSFKLMNDKTIWQDYSCVFLWWSLRTFVLIECYERNCLFKTFYRLYHMILVKGIKAVKRIYLTCR